MARTEPPDDPPYDGPPPEEPEWTPELRAYVMRYVQRYRLRRLMEVPTRGPIHVERGERGNLSAGDVR